MNQGGGGMPMMAFGPGATTSAASAWTEALNLPVVTSDARLVELSFKPDESGSGADVTPRSTCAGAGALKGSGDNAPLHACDGERTRRAEVAQIDDGAGAARRRWGQARDVDVSDLAVQDVAPAAAGPADPIHPAHE